MTYQAIGQHETWKLLTINHIYTSSIQFNLQQRDLALSINPVTTHYTHHQRQTTHLPLTSFTASHSGASLTLLEKDSLRPWRNMASKTLHTALALSSLK